MADKLDQEALDYHRLPTPGKIAVVATKPLANQHDLSLAYSPGVAAASMSGKLSPLLRIMPKADRPISARINRQDWNWTPSCAVEWMR